MSVVIESHKVKRLNILELRKNPWAFGRFIMALRNLIDSDDWARICGIHGNTFKPCDPCVKCPTDPATVTKIGETGEPFYCKHSVYSFIAWHTPYVYQFELLLNKYNRSADDTYITLPWLDLTDTSADYGFLNDPEITILYEKRTRTIENPLAGAYYYVHGIRTRTVRQGFFTPTNKKQHMQINTVRKQLNNALYATQYEEFSSAPTKVGRTNTAVSYVPLETPHNSLHDIIGGNNGNMSNIDIAAFDPVFWLHHCNMDRHYYSWMYYNTLGFTSPIYPSRMTDATYKESCAPFFKDYIYSDDCSRYKWGWENGTSSYMKVGDALQLHRFPYTYDIIEPAPRTECTSYIELIDIPIPRESVEINVYIHPVNTTLDKTAHYAGSGFWFGINRDVIHCCRCNVGRTTMKIDVEEYVSAHRITASNIGAYTVHIEAEGSLIKRGDGIYSLYTEADVVKDGSRRVVIAA
jgi:hypothetical protein